jgi:hypothetical protein
MFHRPVAVAVAAVALIATGCGAAGAAGPSSPPSASQNAASSTTAAAAAASPIASATASPAASDGPRVVGIDLIADPANITSVCPIKITFNGRITAAGGHGQVSYRWVSSDGDKSATETVSFSGPGTAEVTSDWRMDDANVPSRAGWSSIEIVDPAAGSTVVASPHASFAFTCDPNGFETIGFGIGGSDADCSLATHSKTFAPTDRIRLIADYSPSLQANTVVTISLTRGGVAIDGYPLDITLHESTKCLHGNVSKGHLDPGHYRLDIVPDTSRSISGEFDVK